MNLSRRHSLKNENIIVATIILEKEISNTMPTLVGIRLNISKNFIVFIRHYLVDIESFHPKAFEGSTSKF